MFPIDVCGSFHITKKYKYLFEYNYDKDKINSVPVSASNLIKAQSTVTDRKKLIYTRHFALTARLLNETHATYLMPTQFSQSVPLIKSQHLYIRYVTGHRQWADSSRSHAWTSRTNRIARKSYRSVRSSLDWS